MTLRPHSRSTATVFTLVLASLLISPGTVAGAQEEPPGDRAPAEPLGQALQRWRQAILETVEALTSAVDPDGMDEPAMAKVVRSGPHSSGAVALTFDDGYNSKACARIANTLRRHGATGTFFINGNHLKNEPGKWRRILEGMPVANHTRSHHDLSREVHRVVRKQIRENEAIHERVLGRPMLKLLRPPYGAYGERIRRIAAELGYEQIVLWNVDAHDWKRSASVKSIVRNATGAPPGSVVLMHCSRNATAKALPSIIGHYRARGIELAGLREVLEP